MTTTYKIIRDDYVPGMYVEADDYSYGGDYPGSGTIVTQVTGDLAERVQVRSGIRGDVTIVEERWGDGGCVTCSMEYQQFTVNVNGQLVYESPSESAIKNNPDAEGLTTIGEFNAWLNGAAD